VGLPAVTFYAHVPASLDHYRRLLGRHLPHAGDLSSAPWVRRRHMAGQSLHYPSAPLSASCCLCCRPSLRLLSICAILLHFFFLPPSMPLFFSQSSSYLLLCKHISINEQGTIWPALLCKRCLRAARYAVF